jgi:hypothetical protein
VNEAIRPKFLDSKEGALVVSPEPFVAVGRRGRAFTERNLDNISSISILDVSAHDYHLMDVSWASDAGKSYVHPVDRAGYADIRARFNSRRRGTLARLADDEFFFLTRLLWLWSYHRFLCPLTPRGGECIFIFVCSPRFLSLSFDVD